MRISKLKQRMKSDRAMATISIRMPEDVIDDLKQIAPRLGFSGYQPLLRAYVGQGLRADLERLASDPRFEELIDSLKRQGVEEAVIRKALEESKTAA